MNTFKPKSPNPSIKKPADATPAVLGQLNEVVAQKADNENYKSVIYDVYPFPILPAMIKTGSTVSDTYNPGDQYTTFDTYKIKGSIFIDSGTNYANWYLGSLECKEGCIDMFPKLTGGIRAYDYFADDSSYELSSLTVGGLMADSDSGSFHPLTDCNIYSQSYQYTWNGVNYTGFDFYLQIYAADAVYIQGEITFEIEVLFNDFCNKNNNLTFYFD